MIHERAVPIGTCPPERVALGRVWAAEPTRKLASASINELTSYGADFKMPGKQPYTIAVKVDRPGAQPIETRFEFRP